MRYHEFCESSDPVTSAEKTAREQEQKRTANQNISDARKAGGDALRKLHDRQTKAKESGQPQKSADALQSYQRSRNSASQKEQRAKSTLAKLNR